jgi:hypothetical protein
MGTLLIAATHGVLDLRLGDATGRRVPHVTHP